MASTNLEQLSVLDTPRSKRPKEKNNPSDIQISWVQSKKDIKKIQKFRYKVFVEEMGANIDAKNKIDEDIFDSYCEHLIVKDTKKNKIIGTYRVLTPLAAKRLGYLYSETEFDIGGLGNLKDEIVEVGRACVHKDYRSGYTIMLMWSQIGRFMKKNNFRYLIGCSSVPMSDGGILAANIYRKLYDENRINNIYGVKPKIPLSSEQLHFKTDAMTPPLLKGYLRLGAIVCGKPAWDPDFNSADFLTLLDINNVPQKYANHFLNEESRESTARNQYRTKEFAIQN